jgi:hypothetical protein
LCAAALRSRLSARAGGARRRFEQANKYALRDADGSVVGYLAEDTSSVGSAVLRQVLGKRRGFVATLMDPTGRVLMRVRRPPYLVRLWKGACPLLVLFSHHTGGQQADTPLRQALHLARGGERLVGVSTRPARGVPPAAVAEQRSTYLTFALWVQIESTLAVEDEAGTVVGEVLNRFHLLKRNYDLFLNQAQFGTIQGGFLAWDFQLTEPRGGPPLARIDRNFSGWGKELFTDAGQVS